MLKNNKKRVLSGMRATGRLHIGNYLGAIKGMIELQENPSYEVFYMVADVHAITTPYDIKMLKQDRLNVVLDYLSAGLDPRKSSIFIQSEVSEHTEFSYYLSSVVTIARMLHLPTYKDKIKQYPESATMALLNYPVLMASDILLYKSDEVPVGVDQEPHLEVAREIARKMNDIYGTDFPEPVRFATKGSYIPSLLGDGKMSKTIDGSFINLTDDLDTIINKLAKAPTDSGRGSQIPVNGSVANLFHLVELFEGEEKKKYYEEQYLSNGIKYNELKHDLAGSIYLTLEPIQEKRKELEENYNYINSVLSHGAEKSRVIAQKTITEVKEKMGFI